MRLNELLFDLVGESALIRPAHPRRGPSDSAQKTPQHESPETGPEIRAITPEIRAITPEIRAITIDEREVGDGTLYIARRGYYGDGHERIESALAAGAVAIAVSDPSAIPERCGVPVVVIDADDPFLGRISDRFYGSPTSRLRVFGVTGTNGKTTVAHLVAHMLRALGERPAIMGTIEYRFERQQWPATNTTPDALFIHRFARHVRDAGATALVLEVSSHALAIERTAGVAFDSVGFTQLGHDHLDFHQDVAAYRAAKQALFDRDLSAAARRGKPTWAAACVEGPEGAAMLAATPESTRTLAVETVARSARGGTADVCVTLDRLRGAAGMDFSLHTPDGVVAGHSVLVGRYNLANIGLAAAMVAGPHPGRWPQIVDSVGRFRGPPGRLQSPLPPGERRPPIFVDYAHTPDALARTLEELQAVGADRLAVVVGCGGERDPTKRASMARVAVSKAAHVVLTSDNPRGEDPEAILNALDSAARAESDARCRVRRMADRGLAIDYAVGLDGVGAVLIAGKGHERFQEIAGRRHPFDDAEEVRRAVAARAVGRRSHEMPLIVGWSTERVAAELDAEIIPAATDRTSPALWVGRDGPSAQALPVAVIDAAGIERFEVRHVEAALRRLAQRIVGEARRRAGGLWIALLARPYADALRTHLRGLTLPDLTPALDLDWTGRVTGEPGMFRLAAGIAQLAPMHRGLMIETERVGSAAHLLDGELQPDLTLDGDEVRGASTGAWIEALRRAIDRGPGRESSHRPIPFRAPCGSI